MKCPILSEGIKPTLRIIIGLNNLLIKINRIMNGANAVKTNISFILLIYFIKNKLNKNVKSYS